MKLEHRMMALVLAGILLVPIVSLGGCAPKAEPLGVMLDTPQHHVLSGMKLLKLERYSDALREFELTKQCDPVFSKAYVGSGLVWGYKGDPKKGLQDMAKAKDLAKTDEERVFADAGLLRLYLISRESAVENWLGEAELAYNDAIALLPKSSEAHYYMGKVYQEAGQLDKARNLFEKVLEINKTYVDDATHALNLMGNTRGN